jgi:hypothetical protein
MVLEDTRDVHDDEGVSGRIANPTLIQEYRVDRV